MNSHHRIAAHALASVLALGLLPGAHAADEKSKDEKGKEKCYGVSKAGANDCSNLSGSHSCAGQSKNARSLDEWNYVAKGSCVKMGGKSEEEAKAALPKE